MKSETTQPTFEHNGVTITLAPNGKFTAMGPEGRIASGSLEGIKKRLDKTGVFKPFKAFMLRTGYYGSSSGVLIQDCTVVGIVPARRRCYHTAQWKLEKGDNRLGSAASEVYLDTPANRAAAEAYAALVAKHKKVRDEQDDAEHKALAKIKSVRPEKKES